jgi:hypothetical protein
MALVSFGPQKYLDAQFGLIWPAVVLGQVAAITILICVLRRIFGRDRVARSARAQRGQG